MGAFQFGKLQRAVHTRHLEGIVDAMPHHGHAIGHGHGDHVGQVVLFLRVVVVQARQPLLQVLDRRGHDAAVDLANGAFGIAGVLVLDDALHLAVGVAHDAAVAGGIGQAHRQQRQLVAARRLHQIGHRGRLREWHVTGEHYHHALIGGQLGHGLLHRMAGAELRLLAHELRVELSVRRQLECAAGRFHLVGTVPRHHHHAARRKALRLRHHMLQQWPPGQSLQNFGSAAFHARALARGHDDDVELRCHV
ncbi:hypothetical protein SDC9_89252 [bioreactor metagenome]|uniref:Uncharacterized protein n=1 Tax=bioreactor metagenome TaxID=1076179 RepID=A0A644ZP93_9ZZZZ